MIVVIKMTTILLVQCRKKDNAEVGIYNNIINNYFIIMYNVSCV